MGRLSSFAMQDILRHLDNALLATRAADPKGYEGNATWFVRMARERLMEAAIGDVAVELVQGVAR